MLQCLGSYVQRVQERERQVRTFCSALLGPRLKAALQATALGCFRTFARPLPTSSTVGHCLAVHYSAACSSGHFASTVMISASLFFVWLLRVALGTYSPEVCRFEPTQREGLDKRFPTAARFASTLASCLLRRGPTSASLMVVSSSTKNYCDSRTHIIVCPPKDIVFRPFARARLGGFWKLGLPTCSAGKVTDP